MSASARRQRPLAPQGNPFAHDGSATSFLRAGAPYFLHPTQCRNWARAEAADRDRDRPPPSSREVQRVRARLNLLNVAVDALAPVPRDERCCCLDNLPERPRPRPGAWWSGVVSPSPHARQDQRAAAPGTEVAFAAAAALQAELPRSSAPATAEPPPSPASVESQVSTTGRRAESHPQSETHVQHAPATSAPHTPAKHHTAMPREASRAFADADERQSTAQNTQLQLQLHQRPAPPQSVSMSDSQPAAHLEPPFKSLAAPKGGVTATTAAAPRFRSPPQKGEGSAARRRRPLRARRVLPPMQVRIATSPTTPPTDVPNERRAALERLLESNATGNFSIGATDGEPAPPTPSPGADQGDAATDASPPRAPPVNPREADNGHTLAFMACIVMVGLFFIIISN